MYSCSPGFIFLILCAHTYVCVCISYLCFEYNCYKSPDALVSLEALLYLYILYKSDGNMGLDK